MCAQLWCSVPSGGSNCRGLTQPLADGTTCGDQKVTTTFLTSPLQQKKVRMCFFLSGASEENVWRNTRKVPMLSTEAGPAGLKTTLNVHVHVRAGSSTGQGNVTVLCK